MPCRGYTLLRVFLCLPILQPRHAIGLLVYLAFRANGGEGGIIPLDCVQHDPPLRPLIGVMDTVSKFLDFLGALPIARSRKLPARRSRRSATRA